MKINRRASTSRLSALNDGIYAIAMTIIVLSIAVPPVSSIASSADLNAYLLNTLSIQLVLYFISFLILSAFWVVTNTISVFKIVDRVILFLNLIMLSLIVLIPFATSLVANFHQYYQPILFFSILILIIGLLQIVMYQYAIYNRLVDKDIIKSYRHYKYRILSVLSIPVFLSIIAIIFTFINPNYALLVYFGIIFVLFFKNILTSS